MHKFLSEDWIKAYEEEWNKNQKLKEELKDFSASIKYYIEGKEGDAVHLAFEGSLKMMGNIPTDWDIK
jgi:hypothetical protein